MHIIFKRKDVKPYPIKLDNGPLSLAICLGTMVATMFMFFAKVPVATVCLTAYYYIFVCVFTGSLRQWKWTRIYGQLQIALFQPRGRHMGLVFNNRRTNCKLNQDGNMAQIAKKNNYCAYNLPTN